MKDKIRERLFEIRDEKYKAFNAKLIPNISPERIIGVRNPALRTLAKEMMKNGSFEDFMAALPHEYNEENMLHAMLLSEIKDKDKMLTALEAFAPHIDNWAVNDTISPRPFAKDAALAREFAYGCIDDKRAYHERLGILMLMKYCLGEAFDRADFDRVIAAKNDDYYVRMMQAWYFATALVKNEADTVAIFEQKRLAAWTHNKAIQKACESFRVSDDLKAYLKTLKV